jgi:uncharacterized protein (DUF362 family)
MRDSRRVTTRRAFLGRGLAFAAAPSLVAACGDGTNGSVWPPASPTPSSGGSGVVALTRCRGYGGYAELALRESLDRLGGIGALVRGQTVTVKVNLTGRPFAWLWGRPPGETYITHGDTALGLARILVDEGARRVRIVESAPFLEPMEEVLDEAGWDVRALLALPGVECENTRNLGQGSRYSRLVVPGGGHLFSYFELNHAYEETDVLVSLCKLKEHETAGVTLSLKNLFGITPNSLYGTEAGTEDALGYRFPVHAGTGTLLPGEKPGFTGRGAGVRVPRTIVDLALARPIDLAIVDGISAMRGGEGSWSAAIAPTAPQVLVVGRNAPSTDAVATAVMGFAEPRAPSGVAPFERCLNHLLLADEAGLGTADLGRIEVRGLSIAEARYPYR